MHGVQNHWIEYNDSDNAFGTWSSPELLNLALFMGIGWLWKYTTGHFFLSLEMKSMIKNQVNRFHYPLEGRSLGSRTLRHDITRPLSIWKWNLIQALCCSYKSSHYSTTEFTVTFFFFFLATSCCILVPWPGIEPMPSAVKAWILNHWTAREVPTATSIDVSQKIKMFNS